MSWPGWHIIAQSSCDDHMILEGPRVPEAVEVPYNYGSDCNLGCNWLGPLGHGQVWLGLISVAGGVLTWDDRVNLEEAG